MLTLASEKFLSVSNTDSAELLETTKDHGSDELEMPFLARTVFRPTRNAIATVCTASERSSNSCLQQLTAAAESAPVHTPEMHVSVGLG